MSELLTGFGKLEARNLVRTLLKIKLIEKFGMKEDGKQKHQLYRKSKNLTNPDLRYSDMPAFAYSQFKCPGPNDFNGIVNFTGESTQMLKRKSILFDFINAEMCVPDYRFKELVSAIREEEKCSEFTIDRRTVYKIIQNMADQNQILVIRRVITLTIMNPQQSYDGDDDPQLKEGTFYVSMECDENTLNNFIRQYRTRQEIDSLLRWNGPRRPYGRMQGEFDIPKFQRLKAVHLYFWYLAWGHELRGQNIDNSTKPIVYSKDGDWKSCQCSAPLTRVPMRGTKSKDEQL